MQITVLDIWITTASYELSQKNQASEALLIQHNLELSTVLNSSLQMLLRENGD